MSISYNKRKKNIKAFKRNDYQPITVDNTKIEFSKVNGKWKYSASEISE